MCCLKFYNIKDVQVNANQVECSSAAHPAFDDEIIDETFSDVDPYPSIDYDDS